jgi:hypothetical protein
MWDATLGDVRKLASAVTKANIPRLELNGACFKEPVLDMINNGRRYNPILELMCGGATGFWRLLPEDRRLYHGNEFSASEAYPALLYKIIQIHSGETSEALSIFGRVGS